MLGMPVLMNELFFTNGVGADTTTPVYILIGNSVALGSAAADTGVTTVTNGYIWEDTGGTWDTLISDSTGATSTNQANAAGNKGPEMQFMQDATAFHSGDVYLIKAPVNGSDMHTDWLSPDGTDVVSALSQIDAALANLTAAEVDYTVQAIICQLGENDADTTAHATEVYQNTVDLCGYIRSHLNDWNLKFVFGDAYGDAVGYERAQSSVISTVAGEAATVTKPTGLASGDLRLAALSADGNKSLTESAGYSVEAGAGGALGTTHQLAVYSKTAGGSEVDVNFTWTGSEHYILCDLAIQNHNGIDTVGESISASARTEATVNPLTTTTNNCRLFAFCASDWGAAVMSPPDATWETVYTGNMSASSVRASLYIFTKVQPVAGSTGSLVFTQDISEEFGVGVVAVAPATGTAVEYDVEVRASQALAEAYLNNAALIDTSTVERPDGDTHPTSDGYDTLGSFYFAQSKTAGAVADFTFNDAAGIQAMWLADTGITESGGLVSNWADQSPQGNDMAQATSTNQPAAGTDTYDYVEFDGVDNYLTAGQDALDSLICATDSDFQIYFLTDRVTSTGFVMGKWSSSGGKSHAIAYSGNKLRLFTSYNIGATLYNLYQSDDNISADKVLEYLRWDGSIDTNTGEDRLLALETDGVAAAFTASTTGSVTSNPVYNGTAHLTLGALSDSSGGGAGSFWGGKIYGIIVAKRINATTHDAIEALLNSRFGLSALFLASLDFSYAANSQYLGLM